MEKEITPISANINNLIALCHILDDYIIFKENLEKIIKTKYNRNIIYNLFKISTGKHVIGSSKMKKFYQNNKSVIDTINKYSGICNFINYNYDCCGNIDEKSNYDYFYKYISGHQNDLEKIISLLEKIKELGFYDLKFSENFDFTNKKYVVYTSFNNNFKIPYLDNMVAIPNYQNDVVIYKTTGSNFEIITTRLFGELREDMKEIKVNSLLFDYKLLPHDITKEAIFDKIVSLKEEQKEVCNNIINSVNLSIGVDDLYSQFNITSKNLEKIENIDNKEQLRDILLGIKEYLNQLKTISSEYDESVSQSDSPITKEKLEKEKQLYLERRIWESMDID